MRLFLIPISTRRALVYSRPLAKDLSKELSFVDRISNKAAETWAKWEEADQGWKKQLISWGNRVQQRIPYEEWALKSIPSLAAQRRLHKGHDEQTVDVLFPGNVIETDKVTSILRQLATERQDLDRRRMWWSILACPVTAPIGLIPLVPNIPFFYLAYRGWSHWRALSGSKHLEFLVEKTLLNPKPLPELEALYASRVPRVPENTSPDKQPSEMVENVGKSEDRLLLELADAKKLATILDAPELVVEAERAILQVAERPGIYGKATQNARHTGTDKE